MNNEVLESLAECVRRLCIIQGIDAIMRVRKHDLRLAELLVGLLPLHDESEEPE